MGCPVWLSSSAEQLSQPATAPSDIHAARGEGVERAQPVNSFSSLRALAAPELPQRRKNSRRTSAG